jgi:mRNA interferase RelE/StbE
LHRIVLLPEAEKFYKRLFKSDRPKFERVANALASLREDPFQGKPLKHKLKGKYSLRVGVYRIIYRVDQKIVTVYVLDIGHRKSVYRQSASQVDGG